MRKNAGGFCLLPGLYPAALLPRPAPGDLKLKGKTQKSADHYDQGENAQVLEGRRDGNCSDDVPRNEQFQPKKNGATQILTICGETIKMGQQKRGIAR